MIIQRNVCRLLLKVSPNYLHLFIGNTFVQIFLDTIIELSKLFPKISKDSYERTLAATYNCYKLKELEKYLPSN